MYRLRPSFVTTRPDGSRYGRNASVAVLALQVQLRGKLGVIRSDLLGNGEKRKTGRGKGRGSKNGPHSIVVLVEVQQ